MAYPSSRAAVESLIDSARAALQCIAQVEVVGSTSTPGLLGNLVIVPFGDVSANSVLLRRSDRTPYFHLKLASEYAVVQHLDAPARLRYEAIVTTYLYAVRDLNDRELFAYHWHPKGLSSVHEPHMHVSSARPVALPTRPGHQVATELTLSRIHFPTHRIELAEMVRFLIIEFGVGPRRPDWEAVLERNQR